jgi:diguanylate cyclase (GGDEF)-like protein/PAS domain S-box-containing protein
MPTLVPDLTTRLRAASRLLALAVVFVSSLALLGRLTQTVLPPLAQPVTVTAPSAWMLLLAGLSLWLRDLGGRRLWRRSSLFAAAAVVGLALVALTSHGPPPAGPERGVWTAMAVLPVPSGLGLLLLGLGLLVLDWELRSGVRPAQLLACGVVLAALAVLLGYLYGVPRLYAGAPRQPVPIQESIVLLLAGTAVLSARPDRGLLQVVTSETAGGVLARAMPAAVLLAPAALGWLTLEGHRLGWYDAPTGIAMLVLELVVFFSLVIFRVAHSLDRAERRRTGAERQLRQRSLQRANVADLGQRALTADDPQRVREEAVHLLVNSLSATWGEFLEVESDDGTLRPTVGPDRGSRTAAGGSVLGRALAVDHPVLVDDLAADLRSEDPRLDAHGVISAAAMAVHGAGHTHGVIAIYADRRAAFAQEDGHLLQTVANLLAAAEDRRRTEAALRLSEAKFSGLFRSIPDAIAIIRRTDRHVIEVNDAFVQMTELRPEDIVEQPFDGAGLWLADEPPAPPLLGDARLRNVEIRFRTKSGGSRVGLCSTELVTLSEGAAVLAVIRDISERKEEQDEIERTNARLGRWVEQLEARSREISLLNELGELLHACATAAEACEVTTQFARQLLPGTAGALCLFVGAELLETAGAWGGTDAVGRTFTSEDCWALRRGRTHAVAADAALACAHMKAHAEPPYLCVPMVAQGEPLGILHVSGAAQLTAPDTHRLVEALAEAAALALANLRLRDRLRRQSIRDQLTGLFNRWYLEESLERELLRAYRSNRPLGLILMDFDDFKTINDTFGHDAGDELLRAAGGVFRTQLRSSDFACRYGGDEFLLILPETALTDVCARAEDLRSAIRRAKVRHRGRLIGTTAVSSGVVAFPDHGRSVPDLLKAADTALYQAKSGGGDRVVTGTMPTVQ